MALILTIDIGNSATKLALFKNEELVNTVFQENDFFDIAQFVTYIDSSDYVILSNVSSNNTVFDFISNIKSVYHFNSISNFPINVNYKTPNLLGSDRLAAAIGAHHIYPNCSILIIDVGTCITYDFVSRSNTFEGGAISPGLHLRAKALNVFTGKLPDVSQLLANLKEVSITGNSTINSILSGIINSIRFEIEGYINYYKTIDPNVKVFLTGGQAELFVQTIKNTIFVDLNLVMKGLHITLQHHLKSEAQLS